MPICRPRSGSRPPIQRRLAVAILALAATATAAAAAPPTAAERRSQWVAATAALSHDEILAGRPASAETLVRSMRVLAGKADTTTPDRARIELAAAELTYYRAFLAGPPYDKAIRELRAARRSAEQAADRALAAEAQDLLALALYSRDFRATDHAEARTLLAAALAARRQAGDVCGVAESLFHLGLTYEHRDHPTPADTARARELYRESLAASVAGGCPYEASYAERHLAAVAQEEGDLAAARAGFERSLALRREAGATLVVAPALNALGELLAAQGEIARARGLYEEAIAIARRIGSPRFELAALEGLDGLEGTGGLADCAPTRVEPRAGPPPAERALFALSVSDLDRLASWYTALLGFQVELPSRAVAGGGKAVLLSREGARLELMEMPAARSRAAWGMPAEAHQAHGIFKIGLEVADLDALFAKAQADGLTIFFPPVTPEGSHLRTFGLLDPDRNIVQFFGE